MVGGQTMLNSAVLYFVGHVLPDQILSERRGDILSFVFMRIQFSLGIFLAADFFKKMGKSSFEKE